VALSGTSFKSTTPLQDRQAELGMDVIAHCDDTLQLQQMLVDCNSELDILRDKRHLFIHNLHRITEREVEIDKIQDAAHKRIGELEFQKKRDMREINKITEDTKSIVKRFEFRNCNVNIA